MSSFERIALIGFGEVGQILAEDLAATGITDIAAYDIKFAEAGSIPSKALATHKVRAAASAAEAVREAELILCAVTAASDLDAAQSALEEARLVLQPTRREAWIASTLTGLAEVALRRGDSERAEELLLDARARYASRHDAFGVADVEERLRALLSAR